MAAWWELLINLLLQKTFRLLATRYDVQISAMPRPCLTLAQFNELVNDQVTRPESLWRLQAVHLTIKGEAADRYCACGRRPIRSRLRSGRRIPATGREALDAVRRVAEVWLQGARPED